MTATLRMLDHTADMGLEVEADSAAEAVEAAARGMFEVLVHIDGVKPAVAERIEIAEEGHDLLLRAFLAELLFRFLTHARVYASFKVDSIDATRLVATVAGETIDSARHQIRTELKAVTYHQLELRPEGNGWFARVIFDI